MYPQPIFHFLVNWGGTRLGFYEITGLSIAREVIEYRDSSAPTYQTLKMPGLEKYQNIIMKRGILKGDNEFYAWMSTIKINKAERRDLTVTLLDEEHNPVMVWKVKNAWPVRLECPMLKADANEVAIEEIELAHEGITIETF
jgi:phage tail-like protein